MDVFNITFHVGPFFEDNKFKIDFRIQTTVLRFVQNNVWCKLKVAVKIRDYQTKTRFAL